MSQPKTLRGALAARNEARRGELMVAACPSRAVLSHLTSRWGTLVLVVLLDGMHRFSELRREVGGVSEKMLAQTLDALVGDGFVLRYAHPVIPPRVEYSLTPMGREVAERLALLVDWIEENYPRIAEARAATGADPAEADTADAADAADQAA
jgi:DNA-binding HxlR family transcriptional regulator